MAAAVETYASWELQCWLEFQSVCDAEQTIDALDISPMLQRLWPLHNTKRKEFVRIYMLQAWQAGRSLNEMEWEIFVDVQNEFVQWLCPAPPQPSAALLAPANDVTPGGRSVYLPFVAVPL